MESGYLIDLDSIWLGWVAFLGGIIVVLRYNQLLLCFSVIQVSLQPQPNAKLANDDELMRDKLDCLLWADSRQWCHDCCKHSSKPRSRLWSLACALR